MVNALCGPDPPRPLISENTVLTVTLSERSGSMPQVRLWLALPDTGTDTLILAFSHSPSVEAALQAVSRRRQ